MAICPVCEHAQEGGGECTVCGKRLSEAEPRGETVQRLPDLEPTRVEAQPADGVEPMADVDPTRHEAAEAAPGEPALWLERTSLPPQVAERDPFALPTCRYCRTPASPDEVFCARCGLKLVVYSREAPPTGSVDVWRCRFCGEVAAGQACRACGARLASEA